MTKDLFVKFLSGTCTEKEFELILNWIKEESISDESKQMIQEVWDEFEPSAGPDERLKYNRILDSIHHQINLIQNSDRPVRRQIPSTKRLLSLITRAAAILLLPVLSVLIYKLSTDNIRYSENLNDIEVEAPAGFRMNLTLGDGTQVWLNHGSRLKYPYQFSGKNRRVFLTGEAYFKVAHSDRVPFIVETEDLEVRATGTSFNVNAFPGDDFTETTLVDGSVTVYDKIRDREIRELSPNEYLRFNPEKNRYELEAGEVIEKYISWKDGILIFKNDSVPAIARKLSQWYNVDVKITDESVNDFTCTATFYDETLSQVLELMSLPSPVSYKLSPIKRLADGSYSRQSITIALKNN